MLFFFTEALEITQDKFNQKIGFEFGKNLKKEDKFHCSKSLLKKADVKEIRVSDASEILLKSEMFSEILGTIGAGKEATVIIARRKIQNDIVCAKIFRYYTGTIRKRLIGTHHIHAQGMATVAAQTEFDNLAEMYNCGISVPKPIALFDNILLMEFIHDIDHPEIPALLLRDYRPQDEEEVFQITDVSVCLLQQMFVDANFVHGDYNTHNLMISGDKLITMDVSQSVQYNSRTFVETPIRIRLDRALDIYRQDLENLNIGLQQQFRISIEPTNIVDETIDLLPKKLQNFLSDANTDSCISQLSPELYQLKEKYRTESIRKGKNSRNRLKKH